MSESHFYLFFSQWEKRQLCLWQSNTDPAGGCLRFGIFKENQTVPDQDNPGRAPILPVGKKPKQTPHVKRQDGFWNGPFSVCSMDTASELHLSFLPPSAILVLFRSPAFSSSWRHNITSGGFNIPPPAPSHPKLWAPVRSLIIPRRAAAASPPRVRRCWKVTGREKQNAIPLSNVPHPEQNPFNSAVASFLREKKKKKGKKTGGELLWDLPLRRGPV